MPTDADRILGNLPPTFAPLPRPTALSGLADAFGGELLGAENTLAAVMFAHWVDYADTNVTTLTDLPSIASLYGLAPRDDETTEGFRAHLKRYIRTFLDGTVTVRGISRIVAEALELLIADDYTQLDTWWSRPGSLLTTVEAAGDDAAALLFGTPSVSVRGMPARAAEFAGTVDLSQPIDLRGRSLLRFSVDGGAATSFDLAAHLGNLTAAADIGAIVTALATAPGIVAEARAGRLAIRSATTGSTSALELGDIAGDASAAILGIAPQEYAGAAASNARILGAVDLPASLDLTTQRYLRLTLDGTKSFEIDCAAANAAATTPQQVVDAITAEAGAGVASLQANRLVAASPTPGLAGTIALRVPTTGDATQLLFGNAATYARGSDAAPARASSVVDLSAGVDLSQRANLMLAIDAMAPMVVNCAGAAPQKTLAGEIATAINAAIGLPVATQNGQAVTLTSRVIGPAGRVRFLAAPTNDALDLIFGFASRRATGADASAATVGSPPFAATGADLRAQQRLSVAVDDAAPVIVDFAAAGLGRAGVTPGDIANAINAALGGHVASSDGTRLTLTSTAPGNQGSIAIVPIETSRLRPFVSRAFCADEASHAVLGTFAASADGAGATAASVRGAVDLHDGLDLRSARFLRIALDGGQPRDVDCASQSPRPYAVLLDEMKTAIGKAFGIDALASISEARLVLTSPASGRASAVTLLPNAGDVSQAIFGFDQQSVTGIDPQRLVFTGLADLSKGVDLSAADRVKLAIDGGTAVEIECTGEDPAHTVAAEIVGRLNAGLGGSFASTDGTYVRLSSAVPGSGGGIAFLAPSQGDATRSIFGIASGRTYRGSDAMSAMLVGLRDLPAALDLSATPFLRLAIDGSAPVRVDCRGTTPNQTTPAEIVSLISAALPGPGGATAALQGARLALTARSAGSASRIVLQSAGDWDARALLLGDAAAQPGSDATPATLTGSVDLRLPVDLSRRSILRLAIDGGRPVDIDISGSAPDRTFGDEIMSMIDATLPGVAALDANGHLILQSPSSGVDSRIEVQPLRAIEVIEYPPTEVTFGPQQLGTGKRFTLDNGGAAATTVAFTLSSAGGLDGIDLIGLTTGSRIHIDATAGANEKLTIAIGASGTIDAAIVDAMGTRVPLPPQRVIATPSALTALVPFDGARALATGMPGTRPAIALVDPQAPNVVILESVAPTGQSPPTVRISSADRAEASPSPTASAGRLELLGRLHAQGGSGELLAAGGAIIAHVRASAGTSFVPFDGLMVVAAGNWYPGATSLLIVDVLAALFDAKIGDVAFTAVALDSRTGARSLTARLAAPGGPSVLARDVAPAEALQLPRGASDWMLVQCDGSRFDAASFNDAHFAGGPCNVPGIFDVSRFNAKADETLPLAAATGELTRFAPLPDGPPVTLSAIWQSHRAGAFTVNLPADLPEKFGARFNAARFASQSAESEAYAGVVLDPPTDDHYIGKVLAASPLVSAKAVPIIPLGWEGQRVPFGQPRTRFLSGGRADRPSAIYLTQREVPGAFGVFARDNGAWGDEIAISVRYAGPAAFDLTVAHSAARFECARAIAFAGRVLGPGEDPLPALITKIIKPGPVGVVQAKAAGIKADVTRERT
ncbi:hypothetical protein SAMN05444161_7440 [Rhizobiales bacterium GAS191]|nr:hypothetical protein SAMN05444161_7440 [Rhizobiales bacterium GAS191]